MIRLQSAGRSDIGRVRRANEDSCAINDRIGLYLVADGMGGHRAGNVASRIAVKVVDAFLSRHAAEPSPAEPPTADARRRLHRGIVLANRKIYEKSLSDAQCRGMGTTLSALFVVGETLITANVGDSPIYLVRDGEIADRYTPHTLLHERRTLLQNRPAEAARLAHVLTRAVGIRSAVDVDFEEIAGCEGDIVVICSDGLSGKVSREEIRDAVCAHPPEDACRELTDIANQRGGEDNITVIVVRVDAVTATRADPPPQADGMWARLRSRFGRK